MLPHFHKPPSGMDRIVRFMFTPFLWLLFRLVEIILMIHFRFPWNLVPNTRIEYDTAHTTAQLPKPAYFAAVRSGNVKVNAPYLLKVMLDWTLAVSPMVAVQNEGCCQRLRAPTCDKLSFAAWTEYYEMNAANYYVCAESSTVHIVTAVVFFYILHSAILCVCFRSTYQILRCLKRIEFD